MCVCVCVYHVEITDDAYYGFYHNTLGHGRATSGPRARSGPRRPSVRPATLLGNNIAIRPAKPQLVLSSVLSLRA